MEKVVSEEVIIGVFTTTRESSDCDELSQLTKSLILLNENSPKSDKLGDYFITNDAATDTTGITSRLERGNNIQIISKSNNDFVPVLRKQAHTISNDYRE